MDLNPTFGHQELIESMSHGSRNSKASDGSKSRSVSSKSKSGGSSSKSKSGGSSSKSKSGGSSNSRRQSPPQPEAPDSTAYGNAHVDEAYRRLGQRLSAQAHGDLHSSQIPRPIVAEIGSSATGGFYPYSEAPSRPMDTSGGPEERSPKVAKMRYSDHGDHSFRIRSDNILRKLTHEAKQTFRDFEERIAAEKRESEARKDTKLSPSNFPPFSQLSLDGPPASSSLSQQASSTPRGSQIPSSAGELGIDDWGNRRAGHRATGLMGTKGLLSAVLEGHSDSNTSASGPAPANQERSTHTSPASQSISTKGSATISSLNGNGSNGNGNGSGSNGNGNGSSSHASSAPAPMVRGRCLTSPADPDSNDGYDNVEGNLIVYENDMIVVPRKGIHSLKAKPSRRASEFRVQSMLGQGTFAQVFQCMLVTTGQIVAVKVVKNKPAYTRQATIEIDVFRALQQEDEKQKQKQSSSGASVSSATSGGSRTSAAPVGDYMVNLMCYFMHRSHLCLVFELLGLNLYEVLKRRQFRGLPLPFVRTIVQQSVEGIRELSQKSIVHCDLKPENVLLVNDEVARDLVEAGDTTKTTTQEGDAGSKSGSQESATSGSNESIQTSKEGDQSTSGSSGKYLSSGSSSNAQTIPVANTGAIGGFWTQRGTKLIDFGSACFEGYTSHTYIQSRFYRSPEVLIGLPYDSAIDMWSLGCVAAELFLGLPILPGVHEHDQLSRIHEMIAKIPDWMLDQGSKATKYYIKFVARKSPAPISSSKPDDASQASSKESSATKSPSPKAGTASTSPAPPQLQWRLKTLDEYVRSLSQNDIKKKGGLAKLQKQPGNRYFRRKSLPDILALHAQTAQEDEKEFLPAFVHFLYGLLDPDPWKRWTAFQAMQHPFITGNLNQLVLKREADQFDLKDTNHANIELDYYWKPPWDPAICRRKLLNVQKMREKQQAMRRNLSSRPRPDSRGSARMSSGSSGMGIGGMQQADQKMPPGVLSSSPPSQVKSRDAVVSGVTSSSFTNFGQTSGGMVSLGVDVPGGQSSVDPNARASSISGPRSFNSADFVSGGGILQGDLGNALQRPGVVPGASAESFQSYQSGTSYISAGSGSYDQPRAPVPQFQQHGSLPQAGTGAIYETNQQISTSYGGGERTELGFDSGMPSRSRNFAPEPLSAASSVTMEGQTYSNMNSLDSRQPSAQQYGMDQSQIQSQMQNPILQQQQFQPGMNHPQIQNQMQNSFSQQQQFQPGMNQLPQIYGQQSVGQQEPQFAQQMQGQPDLSRQLQGQQAAQFSMQQQPVILAQSSAPGGGFYYVATGPNGQPIVLQPVGIMNQTQIGQQPMNQQQPMIQSQISQQGMVNQQMFLPQMGQAPGMTQQMGQPMFGQQQFNQYQDPNHQGQQGNYLMSSPQGFQIANNSQQLPHGQTQSTFQQQQQQQVPQQFQQQQQSQVPSQRQRKQPPRGGTSM